MSGAKGSEEKRNALEQQLAQFDDDLKLRYGHQLLAGGHCLLLGRHYAQSPYIYFSLNPGFARNRSSLDPKSSGDMNVPFINSRELCDQYVYLKNCQRFFRHHPNLRAWINDGVTSAFLVPWRTHNATSLYALNKQTEGRLFQYARDLVSQILQDHKTELIIGAGKSSLTLLNDLGLPETPIEVDRYLGPGGSYQWSRSEAKLNGSVVTILQIPHFSRANSPVKMRDLGVWLAEQLIPFRKLPEL